MLLGVGGIEPRASDIVGKQCTTAQQPINVVLSNCVCKLDMNFDSLGKWEKVISFKGLLKRRKLSNLLPLQCQSGFDIEICHCIVSSP